MTILEIGATDTLEIGDILKSRFFLRFLNKYQKRYNNGKNKHYKSIPKRGRSAFSQDFYNDMENLFSDPKELQNFCSEFREEMLVKPHIWEKIQSECDDEEFAAGVLTFLKVHFSLKLRGQDLKEVCKIKVREILKEAEETINSMNGCTMKEAIQIGRENNLFPVDSRGDFITFLSGSHGKFTVVRQISDEFAVVDSIGQILQRDVTKIDIIPEGETRDQLLFRKTELELFLKIYNAMSGKTRETVSFLTEEFDRYGDFVDAWIDSQEGIEIIEGEDVFQQNNGEIGRLFKGFLEESIGKLERKTSRAKLIVVK